MLAHGLTERTELTQHEIGKCRAGGIPGKCKRPRLAQHVHHIQLVALVAAAEAEAVPATSPPHIVEKGETRARELGGGIGSCRKIARDGNALNRGNWRLEDRYAKACYGRRTRR